MAKQLRIKDLKDGEEFRISKRSATYYLLQKIERGKAIFTSVNSNRTFTKSSNVAAYLAEH